MAINVVLVIGNFAVGGAENMVYELAKNIDKQRINLHILCYGTKRDNALSEAVEKVCAVRYLNTTGSITVSTVRKVISALDEINPEVVHGHMGGIGFAAIWSFIRKRGFAATIHTRPDKAFSKKIEMLFRMRMRWPKACVVAVSEENRKLVKAYFRVRDNKCTYVNNGIDLEKFYRKPHDMFTFINVARQDENKNQSMLLESFALVKAQIPEAKLLLVGDGPLHDTLKKKAVSLGLAKYVVFTGNVGNVEDYYAQSDAFVLCSYREALPLSVLEAMATGLTVISTKVGGVVELVDGNGILLDNINEIELANAMLAVLREKDKQLYRSSKSLKVVQRFSSREMANKYIQIYDDIAR